MFFGSTILILTNRSSVESYNDIALKIFNDREILAREKFDLIKKYLFKKFIK